MIEVRYKCRCLKAEVTVPVAERDEAQDVVDWVEQTLSGAVGRDHAARSPLCRATTMEWVKIPAPENAPFIGGAPVLNS